MDLEFNKNEDQLKQLCSQLATKAKKTMAGGGEKRADEQHLKGKLTARERIEYLVDPKSPFLEVGLFAGDGMYKEQGGCPGGGVVTGLGKVHGRLCVIVANDATVKGGTYYPLGGEIANLWNNYIDGINVTNTETGASVENLASIRDGHMDLGMAVHVPALQALNGEADFEGNEVKNAAFIGHLYPEVIQIVTREKTKIDSFDDLK